MRIDFREAKSIITKSNIPSIDYVINPYIGCQHGIKEIKANGILLQKKSGVIAIKRINIVLNFIMEDFQKVKSLIRTTFFCVSRY